MPTLEVYQLKTTAPSTKPDACCRFDVDYGWKICKPFLPEAAPVECSAHDRDAHTCNRIPTSDAAVLAAEFADRSGNNRAITARCAWHTGVHHRASIAPQVAIVVPFKTCPAHRTRCAVSAGTKFAHPRSALSVLAVRVPAGIIDALFLSECNG